MNRSVLLASALSLFLAPIVFGQAEVQRFERTLDQIQRDYRLRINPEVPPEQRMLVDYGGYLSLNYFLIETETNRAAAGQKDDFDDKLHELRQYDLVTYARLNIDNAHEFFLRARYSYRDFNHGDSFDGSGDKSIGPTIEQAYYRFSLAKYLAAYKGQSTNNDLVFTGGRQYVNWANGLVLSQYLDGATFDITLSDFTLTLLGGVTAHDTVDFDASRPDFDGNTQRGFYGAMASYQLGRHRPFAYLLVQRDYNPESVDELSLSGQSVYFNYDSWYFGFGSNGSFTDRLVYGVEVTYEGGHGLSDPGDLATLSQTSETIEAAAADLKLDYLLADAHNSRFSFESILATGDRDRIHTSNTLDGNRSGTDDHAFNGWGLLNTGLAFAPNVSNIIVLRGGASTFPLNSSKTFRRLQVGADALFFWKFQSDSPIDEPTSNDRFLGFEPDLYLNWQITSDVTLAVRYGVFFPGSAIDADDNPRNFFFTGLTFAF